MKYGIVQEGLVCKCANCGKVISKDGTLEKNYCEDCGAPLSIFAIADYSEAVKRNNLDMVAALVDVAKKNNTDSFIKILEIYKKM